MRARMLVVGLLMGLMGLTPPISANAASAQLEALWAKMATIPDLRDVDQVIVEGDSNSDSLMGWLEKRNWLKDEPTIFYKRFYSRLERVCPQIVSTCFRVTGIWSNGHLIAGSD